MKESEYQAKLKEKLQNRFPNAFIFKMDPTTIGRQGFPDLIILQDNKWAALEVKKDEKSPHRPNQEAYIEKIKEMGNYSSFIFPQNEKEVLDDLERSFKS